MQLKPVTISEALLVSAGAGALGVLVVFLAVAGVPISNPARHLMEFLTAPKSYPMIGVAFAISFLAALSWILMMYWQQRQG